MEDETKRQLAEKKDIEKRLKEKLAKQKEDEEEKISSISKPSPGQTQKEEDERIEKENMYNKAPSYYQPNIVPQNPLSPDNVQLYNEFIAKLVNPFTPVAELRAMYMLPVPKQIGQIRTTIERHKNGFNRIWPKYTLVLSDGAKFLLNGKKCAGNATSNYMISLDQEKVDKKNNGYLGKVRSNFLGTEFYIFDTGKNPKDSKDVNENRAQHGVIQYETNVLGSKGPRRMKVFLPNVDAKGG